MYNQDTICASSTSQGGGALGMIRVSGKDAITMVNQLFKGKDLTKAKSHTIHFGMFFEKDNQNSLIDEVMVSLFKAPKSFTTEDMVEITCHGSHFIQHKIIESLIQSGARIAEPGEFSQRAFLNGRIDLTQAEAVADLIAAENKSSHEIALNQMRGGVSSELEMLREQLIHFTAMIELELDFAEEDVEFANRDEFQILIRNLKQKIENLIQSFDYGNAIKNGIPVAIIGKPNAGKSTLLNALLNEERAIVSDIAGTTRDAIEEKINLQGITFRFIDTAGIRDTQDQIESIGVQKAKEKIKQAKIIIHLFENDTDILDELNDLLNEKFIFNIRTKQDVNYNDSNEVLKKLETKYPAFDNFEISVKTGYNVELLKSKLVSHFQKEEIQSSAIISNSRHHEALTQALQALEEVERGLTTNLSGDLLSISLKESLNHLGSITGKIEIDKDILGTIFSKFCIGK